MKELEQTPMSDNELIAEFMGGWNDNNNSRYLGMNVPADGNPHWEDQWYDYKDMKYQTSWDWLMPVVQKINKIYFEEADTDEFVRQCRNVTGQSITTPLQIARDKVVEFIKWHNAEKLKHKQP